MKKFHFLILLAAVSLFGCRSRYSNNVVSYKIAGLNNVSIQPGQSGELTLDITKITAIASAENLTLSLSGLPDGVTASINPRTGTPPFTASIVLTDINAAGGTYQVNLIVHSSMSGDNSYPFVLTVSSAPVTNCDVTGYYPHSTAACTANGSYDYVETVSGDSLAANKIFFDNFASTGYRVYGFVNCANGTIDIPQQSLPNFLSVWGTGSFTGNDSTRAIAVSYTTMTQDSIINNCQFSLIQ
jgi:hypothetical protein